MSTHGFNSITDTPSKNTFAGMDTSELKLTPVKPMDTIDASADIALQASANKSVGVGTSFTPIPHEPEYEEL
jgi:hypothetical protein